MFFLKDKVMLSLRMSLTVPLLFLIFISGAVAQDWGVTYKPKSICALKGSAVNMVCTYKHPLGQKFKKAFWSKVSSVDAEPPDLLEDPEYKDRGKYVIDEYDDCSFKLRDVREKDQRKYYFRYLTDKGGKFQGGDGVNLSVTGLQVEVPERVTEGGNVTLTCKTTCILTVRPTFTWYRNGAPLSSSTDQLHLQSVSREDTGRYQCAADGQRSPEVTLNVLYLQVEVPERVIEGGEVTLTCKPSLTLTDRPTFTWYRNGAPLSSRTDQLHLQSVSREDTGRYHCAVEDLKLHSPEVTLNVRYGPKIVSVSISPSGEIVEGSSVTLTCSSDGNPPVQYTWFKGTSVVAKGETYTMTNISSVNSGGYKCRSSNEHGEKSSDTVTLNVLYPPKNVSVSFSPSGEIVEGSSVTLNCSSDGNPPVQKYTWFKKVDKEVLQKWTNQIYTFKNIRSADSGEYQCMANNTQGSQSSEYKSLTVLYGPKSVSLSISPSGEIVEGSSVTLTCSSDGNPPVQNYTWFKGTSLVAKGEIYTIKNISSVNSGGYKCRSSNEHGEKSSDTVTLDVLYPPKNVSVSFSPSGEIVEGSSVTLNCSSDGNPPVQKYTWFKKVNEDVLQKWTNQIYTFKNISSADSGEYQCIANNTQGSRSSGYKSLTVLYGPKSVSLSISPSGEIVEGSSVTLTCSSDGNPPVQNYTWFKGTSLVAKGETFTMTNISSGNSGGYKCRSSNEHGEKSSDTVTLNVLYPPKTVSVSFSPSGKIVEGSSVTLNCSSDGNPPVQKYTWFKKVDEEVLQKWTNQIYTFKNISSADSGEYQCMATNTQGSRSSGYKSLTVLYPPKSVSVSISPSGEIVEGSSVTLTCSSDGNPPVQNYTWFKGTSLVATGETFTMKNISSENSGGYRCRSRNEHGEKYSDTVTLDVLYPPKNISVSISPSGKIVEGSSVTLTCSSDGNPPVQNYTWFKKVDKEVLQKWTNQIYTFTNIRSADSGEYQCMATNTQGSQSSGYKSLTVLYPPKKVWVSISKSALSSSVTLTCSSDANPPVQNYTWFKEGEGSPVGSGHSYSVQGGSYYCVACSEYGCKQAAAVPVTLEGSFTFTAAAKITGSIVCVLLACVCLLLILKWKKRRLSASGQNNCGPSNLSLIQSSSEAEYGNVQTKTFQSAGSSAVKASSSGNDEEVQYASVQHRRDRGVEKTEDDDDVQYASVKFIRTDAANRLAPDDDVSVIYSSTR
ncbi:B-cell receptor CD22-like isoform X1 [Salminus brasiliensis]|uniref:B-cell receptor CD22-like isoform X1 n=1 Tax=Salminus brasiliensis TaxID=930266 RepID=UPI003B838728